MQANQYLIHDELRLGFAKAALSFGVSCDIGEKISTSAKLKEDEHELIILFGIINAINIWLRMSVNHRFDREE
jgi:hypothetical protein